jgi:hypothetical protein
MDYFPSEHDTDIGIYALLCGEWVKIVSAYRDRTRYQVIFLNEDGLSHVYAPGKPIRWVRPDELQDHPAQKPEWTLGGPDYTAEDEAHEAWVTAYKQSELYRERSKKESRARQLSLFEVVR